MQTNQLTAALTAFDGAMQAARPIEFFYAGCGRRRAFLSAADARAYEQGFEHFPAPLPISVEGPRRDGWRDAEDQTREQLCAVWARDPVTDRMVLL